jgi:signal transduction histidine kinase
MLGLLAAVLATAWGEYTSGQAAGTLLIVDIALGVLGCALIPLLSTRPVAGALLAAMLAAVSPAASPPATAATLNVARYRSFGTAVAVGAAGIAAHTARGVWRPVPGMSLGWWVVLVVVVYAALVGWGALAQARHALIASLEERARRAEADQEHRSAEARAAERTRLAREMHDVLAHRLSLLATYAGALEYRPDMAPQRLSEAAGVVRASAHQALDELRAVIGVLREDMAGGDGGTEAPVPTLAQLPELVAETRAVGTPVEVHADGTGPDRIPDAVGRTAYRVIQEALTNARKHAPGQPVTIALSDISEERLRIEIVNPIAPGSAAVAVPGSGTGLVGLSERVRLAGGELLHRTTSNEFRLDVSLPWPP